MTKLFFIKASARPEAKSTAIAEAYLAAARKTNSHITVDTLDLSTTRLPEYDGDKVAAKMTVIMGQENSGAQKSAWDEIVTLAERFTSADYFLFAVPMWNGGIPYKLKQYIDLIHQPGLTFGLDPAKGYFGLLKNKRAVLALTSGAFGPDMPSPAFGTDHHSTYLKSWLNQAGIDDITELRFQPTLLNPDPEGSFKSALALAEKAGLQLK